MGLFGSLKQILAPSKPTASPQSFHVRCLCGEPVQGLRREEHQVISCQVCGSSVFIFPRSALPPPEGKMQGTSLEDMPTTRSAPAPQRQPKRPVAPAARAGAKSPPWPLAQHRLKPKKELLLQKHFGVPKNRSRHRPPQNSQKVSCLLVRLETIGRSSKPLSQVKPNKHRSRPLSLAIFRYRPNSIAITSRPSRQPVVGVSPLSLSLMTMNHFLSAVCRHQLV